MQLQTSDLMTLEAYSRARNAFRAQVIAHKRVRRVALGPHVSLLFEDALTIRYQVQEMLRAERIFEASGIRDELDAYNPLVPDGSNWKATMLIEYPDPVERARMLARLKGVEDCVWVRVEGAAAVHAIADEDLERENDVKTSSVHFLRFELTPDMVRSLSAGAALSMGIDHPACAVNLQQVGDATRASLLMDLAP